MKQLIIYLTHSNVLCNEVVKDCKQQRKVALSHPYPAYSAQQDTDKGPCLSVALLSENYRSVRNLV